METTSRTAENLVRTLDAINGDELALLTLKQAEALKVLRAEIVASPWFADLVHEITQNTGRRSLQPLTRLLSLFGVGEIIPGRMN